MKKLVSIISIVLFLAVFALPVQASVSVNQMEQTQNDGDKTTEKKSTDAKTDKKSTDAKTDDKKKQIVTKKKNLVAAKKNQLVLKNNFIMTFFKGWDYSFSLFYFSVSNKLCIFETLLNLQIHKND